jgi:hypothetical protein
MKTNYIELYLERVLKDYLATKEILEKSLSHESKEKARKDIAEKSYSLSEQELSDYTFKKMGFVTALNGDFTQLKMQLFFTWQAYKDLVEPPKELKTVIEKELEGVQLKTVYSTINGELNLVDKGLYNQYKEQYKQVEEYTKKYLNNQ